MPLPTPPYIADATIDTPEVRYAWDEWSDKTEVYERDTDEDLRKRLLPLSQRARIALTIGVAEWLVYRFRTLLDHDRPLDALEAAWAGVADRKYVLPLASFRDHDSDEWSGPVKGPVRRALLFVNDIIDLGWENGETIDLALQTINLTRYVLPRPEAFEAWLSASIEMLAAASPISADDFIGEVVPREMLAQGRNFDRQTNEALIQRFLASIDPTRNPYLASQRTMLEWGFDGEPYTFDMAADQARRRDLGSA